MKQLPSIFSPLVKGIFRMLLTALILLFTLPGTTLAQTGPAGIGNSTNNVLWLRSDQGTSTTTNGEAIDQWLDISGNANHAAQSDAGKRPEFITTSINGLPALRFGGTNINLVVADNDNLDNTTGLSILVVAQPDNIDAQPRGLVAKRVNQTTEIAYTLFTHNNSWLYFDSPTRNNSETPVTNDPQILSAVYNGATANPRSRIYQMGAETGSGNAPASIGNTASDLYIGILHDNYGDAFRGDMSEVIIYRSALNRAERLIVETYLSNRYNISLSPTGYSSTTHTQDFTGIGHADGDKYSATANMGSGILLAEMNNSLNEANEFVFTGHDGTAHGIDDTDLPTIAEVTLDDRWARVYYIERVQDGTTGEGTTDIRIGFDFDGTGITPSTDRAYYLLYRSAETGEFSVVTGGSSAVSENKVWFSIASTNFSSGYYTIVKTDQEIGTWYSLNDGDWNDFDTWSTNPDIFVNPGLDIPGEMDRVVIQPANTITVTENNTTAGILEVNGILDFGTTTGSSFSTITGHPNGTIRLAADNFPSGDANGFADPATGGTVEYYGSGHNLSTPRSFRNMTVNLDAAGDQLILLADYTLSGSLTLRSGELHFNDASGTTDLNLTVRQHLEVESAGKIRTGSGEARHQLNLYGDFLNEGDVQFTNRTSANYTDEATDGIVDVNILSATRDQTIMLEGPTRFYRIAIEKGTSSTYEVYIEATDPDYFELFGRANYGHGQVEQLPTNSNAFGLAYGTVRVGPNITVPYLNTGGNYNVFENAILWVDGGEVTKTTPTAIVVYGKIIVSAGTLNADINSGITTRLNGVFESRGGTTNLRQFRTSVYGTQHQGGYIQSGGAVNMVAGVIAEDYPRFCLSYTGNVFIMSGGTLHIQQPGTKGGLFINSDPENVSVTGGNVIFEISNDRDFVFTSKAPFWNLELRKTAANARSFIIDEIDEVGGSDGEALAGQPIRVLRDFRISGTESGHQGVDFRPVTDATNVNDVYVGGSFFIESGSQYWTAADGNRANNYDGTANLPTIMNTTWFNQAAGTPAIAYLYWGNWQVLDYGSGTTNAANIAEFGNLVLNRNSGNELRVNSPGPGAELRGNSQITIDVNGDLTVESGTLCQGRLTIRTWSSVTNNDRLGTWYPDGPYPTASGTPNAAQIRFRESEDSAPVISSTDDAVFGNTRFNVQPNSPFTFTNDMYFERLEFNRGILYLGRYNLKVDDMWNLNGDSNTDTDFFIQGASTSSYLRVVDKGRSTGGGSNQLIMIITGGKASDGGLSLKVRESSLADTGPNIRNNRSVLTFPIGFSTDNFATGLTNTYYRPAQVKVTDFSDDGYLNIRPVRGALQTTDPTGGEVLQHHWKVSHSEFEALPTLAYRFYYRNRNEAGIADLPAGAANENNYVPGKVLDESPYTRSYESGDPAEQDTDGLYSSPDADTRVIVFNGDNTGTTDDGLFGFSPDAPGIEAENANYTTGVYQRFVGAPRVYYSRGRDYSGDAGLVADGQPLWTDASKWTRSDLGGFNPGSPHRSDNPASPTAPGAGDIVHIGFFPYDDPRTDYRGYPHGMRIETGNLNCARIVFTQMTDVSGNAPVPRKPMSNLAGNINQFQFRPTLTWSSEGVINAGEMAGEGTIRIRGFGGNNRRDPSFNNVDMGDFARTDSSYVLYEAYGNYTTNNLPLELPNLMISTDGWGANNNTITIAHDFTTYQNFEIQGNANVLLGNGAGGNPTVKGSIYLNPLTTNVGGSELRLQNSGTARTIIVEGNVWVGRPSGAAATGGNVIWVQAGGSVSHEMHVGGDIIINTTGNNTSVAGNGLIFGDGTQSHIDLTLNGNNNSSFININGNAPGFHKLTVNKGNNQLTGFTFNDNFTLSDPTSGAGIPKALTLQNGSLTLNDAGINIDLTTGDDSFVIPSTAGLVVSDGQVNVRGVNSGILLSGLLRADGTGIIDMDGGAGVNNFIEYSASGNAAIEVAESGQLIVGSQIRRGTTNPSGVLSYTQTGGTVTVGLNAAPVNSRGVFEILNTGSRFIHTGGNLTIVRPQSAATEATVLIEPSFSSVGNTTLQIGNAETPESSIFTIKSSIALGNLDVAGSSTARLRDRSLVINRDLTIEAGSSFDGTGNFNLTVNRHIDNLGAADLNVDTLFLRGTNTFPSEAMQQISGEISVNHLVVEPETSVTLQPGSNVEVTGDLFINSGQFNDGGNTITLKGNVTNDASHISSDPDDGGLLFSGTSLQRIYGTGQFGRLEINNTQRVQLENSISLNQDLTITNGLFHIQHHRLTLGQNADVITNHIDGFDAGRMIAVYGGDGFSPLGIRKHIPGGLSGTPTDPYDPSDPAYTWSFTYPVGTDNGTLQKYLPMDLHVASNTTGGYISLIPIDKLHISFSDPGQDENILHQHWNISSSGLSDFTALHLNHYTQDAVEGTEEDYIGARLFEGFWTKYFESDDPPIEVVFENDNYIAITHSGVDEISGDYTAGDPDYIPDEVPIYFSRQDGSWTDPNTWERTDGGTVAAGGPVGQRVHIRTAHTVTIPDNFRRSYETRINGRLEVGPTINHILGYVRGTGTLALQNNSVPAGNYEEFFACSGGTMEYGGPGPYTLTDRYEEYHNLTITGSGTKTLPSLSPFNICNNLTISETAILVSPVGQRIYISGDMLKASDAKYDPQKSGHRTYFIGDSRQEISGAYILNNDRFWNLEIDNSDGVSLNSEILVGSFLYFKEGVLYSNYPVTLSWSVTNAVTGGHANSYLEGPLNRRLPNSGNNLFPIGRNNKYKLTTIIEPSVNGAYWQTEYFNASPTDEGRDPIDLHEDLEIVSSSEYWVITGPTGGSARIRFTLTGTSDIAAGISDLNDLRIAIWDEADEQWVIAGEGAVVTGAASNGTITTDGAVSFDGDAAYFTLATVEAIAVPTAQITSGDADICEGDTYELIIELTGVSPWEIDYTDGTTNYPNVAVPSSPHTILVDALSPGFYEFSLDEVRNNNNTTTGEIYGSSAFVDVYSVPDDSESFQVTSGGDICGPTTTTINLSDSEILVNYQLYRNAVYTGASLAGTGSPLSFTVDQSGTYTIRARNDQNALCFSWMNGNPTVSIGSSGTAEITALLSGDPICEGEEVQLEITFTGTAPFNFTIADNHGGSWSDNTSNFTHSFTIPDPPVWISPDLPTIYTYTITSITDDSGCGAGIVLGSSMNVEVFKIPETGPQYHIPNTFGQ